MEIRDDSKEEKTDIVKLLNISEKRTMNGSSMIRFECQLEDGTKKWYSNWRNIYDKIDFNERKASKGDTLEMKYIVNTYEDGRSYNNFIDVTFLSTSTISQLSAYPDAQYAKPGELPF